MGEEKEEVKKIKTVEVRVLKFMLKFGSADSGYEIAKSYGDINNDTLYNRELKERADYQRDTENRWILNPALYGMMNDKEWCGLFNNADNEELIDLIASKKRLTFLEWYNKVKSLGIDMFKLKLHKDLKKLPPQLRQALKKLGVK